MSSPRIRSNHMVKKKPTGKYKKLAANKVRIKKSGALDSKGVRRTTKGKKMLRHDRTPM